MKCESDGCSQYAEFYDPMGNKLCSDCIQVEVETGEYSWDECEAIEDVLPPNQSLGHNTKSNGDLGWSTFVLVLVQVSYNRYNRTRR